MLPHSMVDTNILLVTVRDKRKVGLSNCYPEKVTKNIILSYFRGKKLGDIFGVFQFFEFCIQLFLHMKSNNCIGWSPESVPKFCQVYTLCEQIKTYYLNHAIDILTLHNSIYFKCDIFFTVLGDQNWVSGQISDIIWKPITTDG